MPATRLRRDRRGDESRLSWRVRFAAKSKFATMKQTDLENNNYLSRSFNSYLGHRRRRTTGGAGVAGFTMADRVEQEADSSLALPRRPGRCFRSSCFRPPSVFCCAPTIRTISITALRFRMRYAIESQHHFAGAAHAVDAVFFTMQRQGVGLPSYLVVQLDRGRGVVFGDVFKDFAAILAPSRCGLFSLRLEGPVSVGAAR